MVPHFKGNLPFITPEQMKEIDRIIAEDYGITLIQVMEVSGQNLAILAREKFLGNAPQGKKVIVAAGPTGNGGGALAAARRLKNWGADVSIILSEPKGKFRPETINQFSICQKLKIPTVDSIGKASLIIDGIKGYSLKEEPSKNEAKIITMINDSGIPVLALETPTGLDLSTGKPSETTVKAEATMALALPKFGHFRQKAAKYIGELFLSDMSVPLEVYKTLKLTGDGLKNVFAESPIVKINKVIVFS